LIYEQPPPPRVEQGCSSPPVGEGGFYGCLYQVPRLLSFFSFSVPPPARCHGTPLSRRRAVFLPLPSWARFASYDRPLPSLLERSRACTPRLSSELFVSVWEEVLLVVDRTSTFLTFLKPTTSKASGLPLRPRRFFPTSFAPAVWTVCLGRPGAGPPPLDLGWLPICFAFHAN